MGVFSNSFEKKWFFFFIFLYVLIMIPFPWYYNESYVPGFFGVPVFLYSWLVHNSVVIIGIILFAQACLKRKDYQAIEKFLEE